MNEQDAILRHIEEHGKITVAEAAAMVPPEIQSTAHYVLHRMEQDGLITKAAPPAGTVNAESFTYIDPSDALAPEDEETKTCPCCGQEIDD